MATLPLFQLLAQPRIFLAQRCILGDHCGELSLQPGDLLVARIVRHGELNARSLHEWKARTAARPKNGTRMCDMDDMDLQEPRISRPLARPLQVSLEAVTPTGAITLPAAARSGARPLNSYRNPVRR